MIKQISQVLIYPSGLVGDRLGFVKRIFWVSHLQSFKLYINGKTKIGVKVQTKSRCWGE
ncbi:hypothetical protein BHE74_00015553 [Ensete ventricosum]|nr:hypothetical protein GW17_00039552 [Ensete ventricosum]RWW76379.1 hypothetical protein BHE74_00015553 [Ensete ventricosum]RZR93659.1 hypothetical protein BHM03_00022211 [Ensete ventricosum]